MWFPPVISSEKWLAGLSLTMAEFLSIISLMAVVEERTTSVEFIIFIE